MGVSGLAIATLLSQTIAAVATAWSVRRLYLRLDTLTAAHAQSSGLPKTAPLFSPLALTEMLRLGIPSVIQHALMSAGQLFMQNIINRYGLIVMAGYSVAFRVNGLVINSLMALSNALSGFIAQNQGAGRTDRIRQGIRLSLGIGCVFSAAVILILSFFGSSLLSVFIEDNSRKTAIISAGMGFFRIISPFYLLVSIKIVYDGALRGIGAMTPFMLATLSDVIVRIFCGAPLSRHFGLTGVWSVWPLAWMVGTVLSVSFYLFCRQPRQKIPQQKMPRQ